MTTMLINLIYRVGFIIMLALIFSRAKFFKNIFSKENQNLMEKVFMGIFFGILSVVGTYTGISVNGAISNTRVIGVAVGGLLGGPFVGILSGFIGGAHRYLIDIDGFTSFSCGMSTLFEGAMAGLLSSRFKKSKNKISFSIAIGIIIEAFQMVFILIVAKPYVEALNLVKIVGVPMVTNNSIGIGLFIMIIENIKNISAAEATFRAKQSLLIADKTLQHLKNGLNTTSAKEAAEIIYKTTDFDAISITDREMILTHIGVGSDHHLSGTIVRTSLTHKVLESGQMSIATSKEDIGCENTDCKLFSSIVIPLRDGLEIVGTLKLYKVTNEILEQDIELAKGLGNIFSSQLEINRLEDVSRTAIKSELHALQAQINPHFLFNAINTIVSMTRSNPEAARKLLIHLSDYFRMNMHNNKDLITLENEMRHVRAYLKIEKARFGDNMEIEYDSNSNMNYLIPPLTIQPIVENAVKHGINKKIDGGKISIVILEKFKNVEITVIDDGVGMDSDKLQELKKYTEEKGIGISNVYRRLKAFYGQKAEIDIYSEMGQGTKVKITIPKRKEEFEIDLVHSS